MNELGMNEIWTGVFSQDVKDRAWHRQGGCCAICGRDLRRCNWDAHHRKAIKYGGSNNLGNCVLLCVNTPQNCHLKWGHDGDWQRNTVLHDKDLPYLFSGER